MYYEKKWHNRPVVTLIKEYCNKKSGKVSEARRELQRRFEWLDWSQQKKIMMAHLQACTSDRQWAYNRILSFWDESFIPVIDELWQTYHEERCSWIIVNHFPEDYLKNHVEELSQGRNYFFICRRLGNDEHFTIDTSRLRPLDHLALMANLGRSLNAATAMDLVFLEGGNSIDCQTANSKMEGFLRSHLPGGVYLQPMLLRDDNKQIITLFRLSPHYALNNFR